MVTINDFIGFYKIAKDSATNIEFSEFVLLNERKMLNELLGSDLAQEFLDSEPDEERFFKLKNPLSFDYNCEPHTSQGIKNVLVGFLFSKWIFDQRERIALIGGSVSPTIENDKLLYSSKAVERFNLSVRSQDAIQLYIKLNIKDYPNFNGIRKYYESYF